MSVTVQSGITSITGEVELEPQKFTTTVIAGARDNSAGTTTLGTVGAGKIWRLVSATLSNQDLANAVSTKTATVQVNGVSVLSITVQSGGVGAMGLSECSNWNYGEGPIATAGQTITLVSEAAACADACVVYIEESA